MELSVREAAALCGKSQRTLRAQLARGELPGTKRNGRWHVDRRHLPLTEAQRRSLQHRADAVRRLVDDALPSRTATRRGELGRSLADLDAFRAIAELFRRVEEEANRGDSEPWRPLAVHLRQAAQSLADAFHQFDRQVKLEAVNRARSALAAAASLILLEQGESLAEPALGWLTAIEREILPTVGGFARFVDRLGRKP